MRFDPAGWPFVGGFAAVAVVLGVAWQPVGAIVPGLLAVAMLLFFRDPRRRSTAAPEAVLAPADGRVMVAGPSRARAFPAGAWQQVTIFLSPLDVHVNRLPVGGRVTRVEYHPGRFLPAYNVEAGDLNEFTEVWLDAGGITIVVRQVVGVLARRIVCRAREGDTLGRGQRFGVMKFGSRMDVFLPPSAEITVRAGARVVGGVTPIARLAAVPAVTAPPAES